MKTAALDETYLQAIRDLVQARAGLVFPPSRLRDLETGVHQTMANGGFSDPTRFMRQLETDDRVFDALLANITVAETYFFREPRQFEVLRRQILPDLRQRLLPDQRIRIWSAGCASGEEPYSLAILTEQEGLTDRSDILATDISRPALLRAAKATYGSWSLRDDSSGLAERYFDRQRDYFVLQERFRRRVDFKYLNLALDMYPSGMTGTTDIDVILCRNVLIYFDQETIRHVARQLFASLRIGGWLITGPSDPPLWDYAPFQTHVTAGGVLYQRGERAAIQFPVPPLKAAPPPIMPISTIVASVAEVAAPAYAETDYTPRSVAESPAGIPDYISRIRALADRGESQQAEVAATAALRTYPLCPELHYLHAIVFMELGRYDDAVASLRRVIYLDPTLAMAHFTLGSMLGRLGATAEARHTYQNVVALCLGRPKDEVLPLSDGELTANLAAAAQAQLTLIGGMMEKAR